MQLVIKNPGEMARTVLIVDDHEHLRHILASVLRYAGYETLEAGTGNQAVATAVSAQPSLILMDLDLPDMTGIDTAKIIKKNPNTAKIPVILLTAYEGEVLREPLGERHIHSMMNKPFSPTELLRIVAEIFETEN